MGISIWQVLIILVIVLLLFGTKKLRNIGGDLGTALKGFKKAMNDEDEKKDAEFTAVENTQNKVSETTESKEKVKE